MKTLAPSNPHHSEPLPVMLVLRQAHRYLCRAVKHLNANDNPLMAENVRIAVDLLQMVLRAQRKQEAIAELEATIEPRKRDAK